MYEKYEHIVIAVVLLCICYIVYREILIFIKGYKSYKKSKQNNETFSIVHIICSVDFFRSLIFGCDSILGILVTKFILENNGIEYNGLLLSIPLTLMGIGSIISQLAFQVLTYKTTIKKIYLISFIGLFIGLLLLIYSVYINDFIIYCIGKFIFGFSVILYLTCNHTIPMCVHNEKIVFNTFRGFSMTDISGSILSIVICGELSYYFDWKSIYIFALLVSVIAFVIIMLFLKNNIRFPERTNSKISEIKNLSKIFIALPMLACLFVSFVSYTTGMYKSFVFPLICQDFGLTEESISYLTSISLIAVYIFSRLYDKITKKIEHWYLTCACLLVCSIIFFTFIAVDNLLWSFITLILSGIVYKSLFVETRMLAPRYYIKHKIEPTKVQPIFDFIDGVSCTIRNPLLGAFMFLGSIGPCIGLGALSLFSLIFFIFGTWNSSFRIK